MYVWMDDNPRARVIGCKPSILACIGAPPKVKGKCTDFKPEGRYSKIVCTQWYMIATHDSRILICESDVHGCWIEAFLI